MYFSPLTSFYLFDILVIQLVKVDIVLDSYFLVTITGLKWTLFWNRNWSSFLVTTTGLDE